MPRYLIFLLFGFILLDLPEKHLKHCKAVNKFMRSWEFFVPQVACALADTACLQLSDCPRLISGKVQAMLQDVQDVQGNRWDAGICQG